MSRRAGVFGVVALAALSLTVAACSPARSRVADPHCVDAAAQVRSLDASTGSVRWTRRLHHPYDQAPTFPGNHLVLTGCGVMAIDLEYGQVALHRRDVAGFVGYSGGYLMTLRDGLVEAEPVEATGGERTWQSTPPYDGATVLANFLVLQLGTGVTVYETGSNEQKWGFTLPTLGEHPTFHLGFEWLVVHADDGSIYGLALSDSAATLRWRAVPPAPDLGYGRVLEVTPRVVVTSVGQSEATDLVALDVRTGAEVWRLPAPGLTETDVAVADSGVLAVPSRALEPGRSGITGLGVDDGRARWRTPDTDGEGLVGTDGTFATRDGSAVVAFDARTGVQTWRMRTAHPAMLAAGGVVGIVVLDSPPVPHGYDDCC